METGMKYSTMFLLGVLKWVGLGDVNTCVTSQVVKFQ